MDAPREFVSSLGDILAGFRYVRKQAYRETRGGCRFSSGGVKTSAAVRFYSAEFSFSSPLAALREQ